MRFKKNIKKLISLALVVFSLLGCMNFTVSADPASDLQSQIADLEQQQKELASKLNAIKNDKSKQNEYKSMLNAQIKNTQNQIAIYEDNIHSVEGKIAEQEAKVFEMETELKTLKKNFRIRIREMVMNGASGNSALLMLMSAEDFGDILAVAEYTKNLAKYDEKIMKEITESVTEIKKVQDELQVEWDALAAFKGELTEKQNGLAAQIKEVNKILSALGSQESSYNSTAKKLQQQQEKLEAELRALATQNKDIFTGEFIWPLPGKKANYYITSPFDNNRKHPIYGYYAPHTGDDYVRYGGGVNGLPIYAAAAGVVSIASNDKGGFGQYVMIDHGKYQGKSYATLYAHMTRFVVKKGQRVSTGQLIGYVGMSGAATGPHLHLEVRVNGVPVKADPYFS